MGTNSSREDWLSKRVKGWQDLIGRIAAGTILYLTLTGLAIYALPFSVFNQHALLLHTVVGFVSLVPITLYLVRHVIAYWDYPLTHVKFSGYLSGLAVAACSISGVVVTIESIAATRTSSFWVTLHLLTTFGTALFLVAHLGTLWVRARNAATKVAPPELAGALGYARLTLALGAVLLLATVGMTAAFRPIELVNEFPADYDAAPYEGAGPFSPSLAMTATGGAMDERSLSGSETCGTAGCHTEIYEEWLPSAHRYSSMDVAFQAIQDVMARQNGPVSTRYCGGCHDPISLFAGTKNIGVDQLSSLLGYQEGISCLACHAIEQTDTAGNAKYVMHQPERYLFELREGPVAKFLSDFLIRAYPEHHVSSLSRRMFKTPEFCAACHKQFIDKEVNQVGWVQLQNQFDNWAASRWHDEENPERTVECRECHMPLTDSTDPAAGDEADANRTADDGKHRSHRFLGANQYIPILMEELEGGAEHAALVHKWLRGEIDIPEIESKWADGPAVPIELRVPDEVEPGQEMRVVVNIINNKVGHDFPTGPLDIIQAWIELDVTDANGQLVYQTGKRDERNFIETGTFMFKAEPVDRYGNLIDRHNLWEMVGVRFKRSLFPGSEEAASFAFECSGAPKPDDAAELEEHLDVALPANLVGPLTVKARLNYRKFDQYLLNFTFGEDAGLTAPITEMSSAVATIELRTEGDEGQ